MSVFFILVLIGLIILWFLLSPLFEKIGKFVINIINKVFLTVCRVEQKAIFLHKDGI